MINKKDGILFRIEQKCIFLKYFNSKKEGESTKKGFIIRKKP